jgi:hypothetical protein
LGKPSTPKTAAGVKIAKPTKPKQAVSTATAQPVQATDSQGGDTLGDLFRGLFGNVRER